MANQTRPPTIRLSRIPKPPPCPPKRRLPIRPPTSRPPSMPPIPPHREGAGCGDIGVGAGRLGVIGAGDAGVENPREPRLPLEPPPPARAQASAVHSNGTSTITNNVAIAAVRLIVILLRVAVTGASRRRRIPSTIPSRAHRSAPRP